jgi:hypothetical protein
MICIKNCNPTISLNVNDNMSKKAIKQITAYLTTISGGMLTSSLLITNTGSWKIYIVVAIFCIGLNLMVSTTNDQ